MDHTKVIHLLSSTEYNKDVVVKGWVRTKRGNKNIAFIAINDGSIIHNIQVFNMSFTEQVESNHCHE